jgi:hypothetical protein
MKFDLQRMRLPMLYLAGIGATLGVLLDGLHSHFGATSYTDPLFAKTAWWAFPLFAAAYAAGISRPAIDEKPVVPQWKVGMAMGLFILAYIITVTPFDLSSRMALLVATFVTSSHFCDPSRAGIIVALCASIIGPFVEINVVRTGSFIHHEAHFLGVPYWLPLLYLNAGVGLGTLGLWLVQREPHPLAGKKSPQRW